MRVVGLFRRPGTKVSTGHQSVNLPSKVTQCCWLAFATSRSLAAVREHRRVAVNFLSEDQQHLSAQFARSGADLSKEPRMHAFEHGPFVIKRTHVQRLYAEPL